MKKIYQMPLVERIDLDHNERIAYSYGNIVPPRYNDDEDEDEQ